MTNSPKENPRERKVESPKEVQTTHYYVEWIWKIGDEYKKSKERKGNPTEAKNLALKQLKELKDAFAKYKSTPEGKKAADKYINNLSCNIDTSILWGLSLEQNISHAEILLAGTPEENIKHILKENTGVGSSEFNPSLLPFLPEKYMKNGQVNMDIIRKMNEDEMIWRLNEYIKNDSKQAPVFDNDLYNKNPELIEKALSKPGTILNVYELINNTPQNEVRELMENTKFINTLNTILAKEYPDFFGQAQGKEWYTKDGISFSKLRVMLDILKYRPEERTDDFLKMMNGPKEGKMEESLRIYENYFIWTEIGLEIMSSFKNSRFVSDLKNRTRETLAQFNKNQDKGTERTHSIIDVTGDDMTMLMENFSKIPERDLKALLSRLPVIETFCLENDEKGLKENMDNIDIDEQYKSLFFAELTKLSVSWDIQRVKFYANLSIDYYKENNAKNERDIIRGDTINNEGINWHRKPDKEKRFTIISKENFPGLDDEVLESKNERLWNLLNKTIDPNGWYQISSKALKEELLEIFKWSPLEKRLSGANGGKQALEILASVAEQEKRSTNKEMKAIENTFDSKKIEELQKNDPEGYSALKKLLESNQSIDVKIDALEKYGIISGNTIKPEDKERFITLAKQSFTSQMQSQIIRSTLDDKVKLQAFESYWRGDIKSPEELNAKIAERDKEIKQAEDSKQGKETQIHPMKSYDNLQSFGTDFSKIPDGRIITYKDGESDIYIKKDSKNEISIFAGGVPIRGIKITNETDPKADITKAMDSVQFIKDCGLDIFGTSLPKMIDIINNKQKGKWERKIDLADGLNPGGEEERILLQYIAKMVDIDAALPIENLRREFSEMRNGHGLLPRLQKKPGYVTANSLNMTTILGDLEKTRI